MKSCLKIIPFILFLLHSNFFSQSLFEENFNYTAGNYITSENTSWIFSPDGSFDIKINDNNLSYSGYTASNIGKDIILNGGASCRSGIARLFSAVSENGETFYESFLINTTLTADLSATDNTSDGYFVSFKPSGSSARRCNVIVKKGSSENKFNIGIIKTSSNLSWYSTELNTNETYLIVIAYEFKAGADLAKLWVNPAITGTEPIADVRGSDGSDAASLDCIEFAQGEFSGDFEIDGLRVSKTWDTSVLPVELSSFTADINGNQIFLEWKTATELNNYGFELQRNVNCQKVWEKIAFIPGNGTCNSEKNYSYNDIAETNGIIKYRLKQIDCDGKYKFYYCENIESNAIQSDKLFQNFPNPFNPETTIKFQVFYEGNVKINIYNILGQRIKTIYDEYKMPGIYSVYFNAGDLPSGVYIYSLDKDNISIKKKMHLIK